LRVHVTDGTYDAPGRTTASGLRQGPCDNGREQSRIVTCPEWRDGG